MRLLGPVLLLCLALSGCTRIFLHPDRYDYAQGQPLDVAAEDVWIEAADGQPLHALLLPTQGRPKATLLFLHGNAENLSTHARIMTWLPAQGYAVLALDYRGFGRSQGETGVDEIHEDAESALAWLVAQGSDKTGALVVYGQSIGASVAIRFVAGSPLRAHVAAVIADSPFSSYRGIAREKLGALWLTWPLQWPLSLLISNRYSAIDVVADLSPIPLLLIHGERDFIVPASHSQRLYDAAREPKTLWLIPDGNHIDAPRRETMRKRLVEFLDGIVPAADR
ncbi:MAG TPA: alpha/beta fold hydrolase [Fontimonas sp.]